MQQRPGNDRDIDIDLERDRGDLPDGDPELSVADSLTEPVPSPSDGPLVVTTRQGGRMWPGRESNWYWPMLGLVSLLGALAVGLLANIIPFNGQTTDDILTKTGMPFQPASWVWAIWGLIFILMAVYVVYTIFPGGLHSDRTRRIGPLFLIVNLASILWLFFWHWEQFLVSVILMAIVLLALALIYLIANRPDDEGNRPTRMQLLMVRIPFSVYLGWITVSFLGNLMVWLQHRGWDGSPFNLRTWAIVFMIAGLLAAAAFAAFRQDAAYVIVFVWAYVAVAQHQWDSSKAVSIFAGIGAVVAAGLAVMAFMLSFDRRAMSGLYTEQHKDDPLPLE